MAQSKFQEVPKEKFKEIYLRLGRRESWEWISFEDGVKPGWRFMVQEPESPEHDQMWIVSDFEAKEYRLFFMTEESTENFFDFPGKD